MARGGLALLAIGICLLLMRDAARFGFCRLLTRYAVATNSLPAADQAVQLTPADPEAHRARGAVLNRLRRTAEAEASLETATALRPRDDYLWLELGSTREELGDNEGALAAFNEAVRWAPYYAHTHWQRGNLLLRMGRYSEAFADLRQASASDRKFFPGLLDLAWGLAGGDAKKTEALVGINNDADRFAFARFLAAKGKGQEVFEQVRLLGAPLSDENKNDLVQSLAVSRRYSDAFRLWTGTNTPAGVVNGGFEEPLVFDKKYFRWNVDEAQAKAKLTIDVAEKFGGAKSLRVSVDGEWAPGASLLSQTVVVQPGQRYRLAFAVKTKDLVTGGPPRFVLADAKSDQILAKSNSFPAPASSWQEMSIEFTTPPAAEAIVIRLARENCASSPCPIFGVVWLDEFSLQKL